MMIWLEMTAIASSSAAAMRRSMSMVVVPVLRVLINSEIIKSVKGIAMDIQRQRDLFTKRERIVRAPPALEVRTHIALADTLRRFCDKNKWAWNHIPLGGLRTKETAAQLQRMGVQPGWHDFIFLHHLGQYYLLELKRPGASLSEYQEAFHARMLQWKRPCAVVTTYQDAVDVLKHWGVLPDRVHVQ